MRNSINSVVGATALLVAPLVLADEVSVLDNLHFNLGGKVGAYNASDYTYEGFSSGVGYESRFGVTSLQFGFGELTSDRAILDDLGFLAIQDEDLDLKSIEFSVRHAVSVEERFDLYLELGAEELSYSKVAMNALWHPISIKNDDVSWFIGLGAEGQLYRQLYATASIRYYLSDNDVLSNSTYGRNPLGEVVSLLSSGDPRWMASVGLSLKF